MDEDQVTEEAKRGFFQQFGHKATTFLKDVVLAIRQGIVDAFQMVFMSLGTGFGTMVGMLLAIVAVMGMGVLIS